MLKAGSALLKRLCDDHGTFHAWSNCSHQFVKPAGYSLTGEIISEAHELRNALQEARADKIPTEFRRIEDGRSSVLVHRDRRDFAMPEGGDYYVGCMSKSVRARVVEPLHQEAPAWLLLEENRKLYDKFLEDQKNGNVIVRALRNYDGLHNVMEIVGVSPCGKCELCVLRRRAQARTSIMLEAEGAVAAGLPLTFWTLTLSTKRRHVVHVDVPGEDPVAVPRSSVSGRQFQYILYLWRKRMAESARESRLITVAELHKDGAVHGHAIGIGFDPAMRFGDTTTKNKHGNKTWTFPDKSSLWRHGRSEVVSLKPEEAPNAAAYIAAYAGKGADLDPGLKKMVEDRDGDYWERSRIGWPRPGAGVDAIVKIASEPAMLDALVSKGWSALAGYPLDSYRKSKVNALVMAKRGCAVGNTVDDLKMLTEEQIAIAEAAAMIDAGEEGLSRQEKDHET